MSKRNNKKPSLLSRRDALKIIGATGTTAVIAQAVTAGPLSSGAIEGLQRESNHASSDHEWHMVIDLAQCIGCHYCIWACQATNDVPEDDMRWNIGFPDRFWHPLVYWNVHAVLWEITLCVILYSTVLVIELLPILFDSSLFDNRPKWRTFGHKLHKLTPVMAVLGLALSMLHQSSLGATYGVLSGRAIWFKPSTPVMFILSAVAGGVSATLLVTMITSKLTHRELIDKFLRRDIARLPAFTLLAYMYLKLWDWLATSYYNQAPGTADALTRLQATTPYSQSFWWIEVFLCSLVPAVILLNRQMRRRKWPLMGALFLVIFDVIINRWNVTLSGLVVPPQWSPGVLGHTIAVAYTPSWVEIAVSVGVLGYALLAFTLGAKYLPLFGHTAVSHIAPTD